ncbi:MAG: hypothetical protein UR30_C0006G0017 [Candidatus Peregrinibacteria bacterium GW2011_GWC2_33_13]|nr:MAG: hypothetical protein UR30_C0006G0017 [Candidatus Peregrinibacteria bacterium GW2011_GWC2_33_13]
MLILVLKVLHKNNQKMFKTFKKLYFITKKAYRFYTINYKLIMRGIIKGDFEVIL